MSKYYDEWLKVMNKAEAAFAKDINSKQAKASDSGLKFLLTDAQDPVVAQGLQALDKISLNHGSDAEREKLPANLKLFKAALKQFEGHKNQYVKDVNEAVKSKPTVLDQTGRRLATPMKEAYPETYRQLKILMTQAEAMYSRAENDLAVVEKLKETDKIDQKTNAAKSNVKGFDEVANQKVKAIQDESSMQKFMLKFATAFKSSMAKGAVAIQKIKSSPNAATYNEQMYNAGRDISQNLVNIGKLKSNPNFKKTSLAKSLPDPGDLANRILPFCNGAKYNLDVNAPDTEVKANLVEFTKLYKDIAKTYDYVIAGKAK